MKKIGFSGALPSSRLLCHSQRRGRKADTAGHWKGNLNDFAEMVCKRLKRRLENGVDAQLFDVPG